MTVPSDRVLDAVVLAFSRSALKEVVGTDALRTVLSGLGKDLVTPDRLKLQGLWDILETQPGFVANDAAPPILLIKTWQARLDRAVDLPAAFGDVTEDDIKKYAAQCEVTTAELEKTLAPPPAPTPAPTAPAKADAPKRPLKHSTPPPLKPLDKPTSESTKRRIRLIIAIGLLVAAAVIAFVMLRSNNEIDSGAVSSEIPLVHVRQSGSTVGAVLADSSWLTKPEDQRKRQLTDALTKIHSLSANMLMVYDSRGKLIATATNKRGIVIWFPKTL
jgi:hypothetical protein